MPPARAACFALAILAAACNAPSSSMAPASAAPGTAQVAMYDIAYHPSSIEVTAGTTVTWINEEAAAHDVTADDGSFASGTLQQGDTWSWTFSRPGTWSYTCTIHPEMKGVVVVK